MKKTLIIAAALVGFALPAFAADMARPVYKAAPVAAAPIHNWSGFYLGGTIGLNSTKSVFTDPYGYITYAPGITNKDLAWNIGATLGYNWQVQSFVFGIEGDWSWTNFEKTSLGYTSPSTIQSQWDWFSTVRVRAGYAIDNILLYVTGGAAFVKNNHQAQYLYAPYFCGQSGGYWSCPSGTETGFVVGAGIEAIVAQNWSLKLEYLYLDMPTITTTDTVYGIPYSWNDDAHVVRLGLNYRFGDYGKSPVVARY